MLFLTSCLSFSLSSCKRRNGRARAHAIRTCRYSNMFEKQNSLYRLKKGAECEVQNILARNIGTRFSVKQIHELTKQALTTLLTDETQVLAVTSSLVVLDCLKHQIKTLEKTD